VQARGSRLAEFIPTQEGLGGHFVFNFGGKNELAISLGDGKIFNHKSSKNGLKQGFFVCFEFFLTYRFIYAIL